MQKELANSINGRTTLKNFFKSSNEKQSYIDSLAEQIRKLDSTERSYSRLIIIINVHLTKYSSSFKKNKVDDFSSIVREIASIEVENSNH